MTAWFDMATLDQLMDERVEKYTGIVESDQWIQKILDREVALAGDSKKVVLGGFSQGSSVFRRSFFQVSFSFVLRCEGSAIAARVGLTYQHPLGWSQRRGRGGDTF